MAGRLLLVPYGEPATARLGQLVAEARAGDPLAPVTVVVPSAVAGATLRRRLAIASGGLANVTFQSLPQLADALAAPHLAELGRPGVPPTVARAHVRAALATDAGALGPVAASAATERALEATVRELADLTPAELDLLVGGGPAVQAAVAVTRRYLEVTGGAGSPGEAVRVATEIVRTGAVPLAPVVVHLPRRLSAAEIDLLAALATTVDLAVVLGRTGHPDADGPGIELGRRLAAALGTPSALPSEALLPPAPTELVRAPDPSEEVAVAVRLVVGALRGDDGVAPLRPERVAVVARVDDPYLPSLHEQLAAAGVPHHASSATTLAQSVAGRTLLGALALPDGDFRRRDVVAWLRGGPVRDPATGSLVPASRWDRIAREAGVVGGLAQWVQRLHRAIDLRRERITERAAHDDGIDLDEAIAEDSRLAALAALGAFVEGLAQRLQPPTPPRWDTWAAWAIGLLEAHLGEAGAATGWPDEEHEAFGAIVDALALLGQLDPVDRPPDLARFRRALERELEQRARPHGTFGRGVVVDRLAAVVGADLDLVIVLGGAEGTLPPRRGDDPLVPDRVRGQLGGSLAPRGADRAEEHRDLLAALASAPRRVLVCPRADPRAQRERQPAPWFLEAAGARAGHDVATAEVAGLAVHGWFTEVESLEWWLGEGRAPASAGELDLAELLGRHRSGAGVDGAGQALAADPVLARGMAAAVARRRGEFDEWAGFVGPADDLLTGEDRPRSPTGLEQYAACPFRYFLNSVLRVGRLEDPTDVDVISALDNGSLVHEVLEKFVRGAGPRRPDEPWTDDDRQRILQIADEVAGRFQAEGRTGREVLWAVRAAQLRHQLLRILDQDAELRRQHGVAPAAVELAFGFDDEPPVVLELDGGRRLTFRGSVDRVDTSPDGDRVVVYDYKTGNSYYYRAVDYAGEDAAGAPGDLTARGTKLQLPIYSLAARQRFPDASEVSAYYWFVDERGRAVTRGGPYDDAADARFRDVVTTVVDGIEAGSFPANPGDETWRSGRWTYDNCRYCDYDRVCPTTRGEQWVQVRQHPQVADYVRLAEQQPTAGDGEAES
jgi:hypothetical protein